MGDLLAGCAPDLRPVPASAARDLPFHVGEARPLDHPDFEEELAFDGMWRLLEEDGRSILRRVSFGCDRTRSLLVPTSSDGTVPISSHLPE
jgi:hypothetical protein